MEQTTKKYLWLITYAIVLFLCLSRLDIILAALGVVFRILKPLLIGICIAFVLNLLMRFYEQKALAFIWRKSPFLAKGKRILCIVLTLLTVAVVFYLLIYFIVPELILSTRLLLNNLSGYFTQMQNKVADLPAEWSFLKNMWDTAAIDLHNMLREAGTMFTNALKSILDFTVIFAREMFYWGLGFVFAIYILAAKERLIRTMKKMIYAFCSPRIADHIVSIFRLAGQIFGRFVGGQLTEAFLLGLMCFIGMLVLHFPYPLLIGILIGTTSLIPVFGAYIGLIPSLLILFMASPLLALWFLIFIIALQQFEGNVVYPRVVGGAIGLSGFWVLLAITVGGGIGGVFGVLLAVPTMALLYALLSRLTDWQLQKKNLRI